MNIHINININIDINSNINININTNIVINTNTVINFNININTCLDNPGLPKRFSGLESHSGNRSKIAKTFVLLMFAFWLGLRWDNREAMGRFNTTKTCSQHF